MDESLAEQVRQRAGGVCEYCRMPQAFYPTVPFPIDHVIARQHSGPTASGNLALSCLHCNSHKGPNIAGIDPQTNRLTRLFHPRRHKWERHFRWVGPALIGRTAVGRVTVVVLAMNDPDIVEVRQALFEEGLFDPVAEQRR
jgi:HNH endonuclease